MRINYGFGSDNHSGVHPDIMKAIEAANKEYTVAYGDDIYTKRALNIFKKHFGNNIDVFFVYNGTAANILGLKNITDSFNSIICAETAHLNIHECCGPEKFTGCKLVTIPTIDGKLSVDLIKPCIVLFPPSLGAYIIFTPFLNSMVLFLNLPKEFILSFFILNL